MSTQTLAVQPTNLAETMPRPRSTAPTPPAALQRRTRDRRRETSPEGYRRIAEAIRFLEHRAPEQPSLAEVAAAVDLSPHHFQRLFRRWAGVSPKRFLQFLTVEHAKEHLARELSVLEASLEVGLSGPSRLHDHFVALEAVTPGEYKSRGAGLQLRYGVHGTAFGDALLVTSPRGLAGLHFLDGPAEEARERVRGELQRDWSGADLVEDPTSTAPWSERLDRILQGVLGPAEEMPAEPDPFPLLVRGTNFQVQVWKALLSIPPGNLASYDAIARAIGRPRAVRAVANAIGANPVAWLIPCHRVLRAGGALGGYRWGTVRKRAMLGWEAARAGTLIEPSPP